MNPLERGACLLGKIMGALAELLPEPANFDDDDRIVDELGGEADAPRSEFYHERVMREAGEQLAKRAVQYGNETAQSFVKAFTGYSLGSNPNDLWTPASTTAIIETLTGHHPFRGTEYILCGCKQKFQKCSDWREHVAPLIAAHLSATVIP